MTDELAKDEKPFSIRASGLGVSLGALNKTVRVSPKLVEILGRSDRVEESLPLDDVKLIACEHYAGHATPVYFRRTGQKLVLDLWGADGRYLSRSYVDHFKNYQVRELGEEIARLRPDITVIDCTINEKDVKKLLLPPTGNWKCTEPECGHLNTYSASLWKFKQVRSIEGVGEAVVNIVGGIPIGEIHCEKCNRVMKLDDIAPQALVFTATDFFLFILLVAFTWFFNTMFGFWRSLLFAFLSVGILRLVGAGFRTLWLRRFR